jgi:hypothetical protein
MKRILSIAAVMATALAACAPARTPIAASAAQSDEFALLVARTETEIRAAEKTGFLWRDTEQLLRDARSAQREGRRDDAMQLANKALRQAQLAQQQARDNTKAAPTYPKP